MLRGCYNFKQTLCACEKFLPGLLRTSLHTPIILVYVIFQVNVCPSFIKVDGNMLFTKLRLMWLWIPKHARFQWAYNWGMDIAHGCTSTYNVTIQHSLWSWSSAYWPKLQKCIIARIYHCGGSPFLSSYDTVGVLGVALSSPNNTPQLGYVSIEQATHACIYVSFMSTKPNMLVQLTIWVKLYPT